MTFAPFSSPQRRLASAAAVALLVAACAVPTNPPTPSPTAEPTLPPTAPPFTLAPAPSDCPTAAPSAMTSGTATVTMVTNYGTIVIKVDASLGPNAAGAFVSLARCGYYNDILFHRIIAGFIIQAGDGQYARLPSIAPDSFGVGGPGWSIPDDKVTTKYVRGMLAMGRIPSQDNSGSSQFFIVLADSANDSLADPSANNYAQFGTVTSGMDVVDKIAQIPTGGDNGDMALEPAVILSTTVTTP
jgi:cyclophilin family peptidyl-prolyl cis-trans isomerase